MVSVVTPILNPMNTDLTQRFTLADNSANSALILRAPRGSRFIPDELLTTYLVDETELDHDFSGRKS